MINKGQGKKDTRPPESASAKHRFGRYKEESEAESRTAASIEQGPAFGTIMRLWGRWKSIVDGDEFHNIDSYRLKYAFAVAIVEDREYDAEAVERFSVHVSEYENENCVGIFISALINAGRDEEYRIFTKGWQFEISTLAYANAKKVTIVGDADYAAGWRMVSGELVIEGTCFDGLGEGMKGGIITLHGDFIADPYHGALVGLDMNGGEIHLNGGFSLTKDKIDQVQRDVKHGKIFHKGALIVDK